MKSTRIWLSAVVLATFTGVIGCGSGGAEGEYPVYPVSGVVQYNGKPVSGATVIFYPADNSLQAAHGMTNDDGRYELTTFNQDDGAAEGSYKVTVKKIENSGTSTEGGEEEAIDPSVGRKMRAKSLIPSGYGNMTKTSLKAEVTKDGDNEFTFDLVD